jgi:hypothetical protein
MKTICASFLSPCALTHSLTHSLMELGPS